MLNVLKKIVLSDDIVEALECGRNYPEGLAREIDEETESR